MYNTQPHPNFECGFDSQWPTLRAALVKIIKKVDGVVEG